MQPTREIWMEELSSKEDFTKIAKQLVNGIVLRSENMHF